MGYDNSNSILLGGDSVYYRNVFPAKLTNLINELQKRFDVKTYSLGDQVQNRSGIDFKDKQTDISSFFGEIESRYTNRNVGAIIMATDGIYNHGSDPFYAAKRLPFPIYTIALGDTSIRKDIFIKKITFNKSVFVGDKFPVEILLEMNKCAGLSSKLNIYQGKQMLFNTVVASEGDRSFKKITLMLDAKSTGIQRFTVRIAEVTGEINKDNNSQDFFIDVVDSRQKIALLFDSPHPDIGTLQQAIGFSSRFEITQFRMNLFKESLARYDLVILNQVPSVTAISNLSELMKSPVSLLFILGSQTDFNTFNGLNTGLIINSKRSDFSDALPSFNNEFSRFSVGKDEPALFREFPPLQSPFGVYQYGPLTDVLFFQQLGNIKTATPLIMFFQNPSKKIGIIAGENLWRWRMTNFMVMGDHKSFDELINKIVQFLAVREDKSFFRIRLNPKFNENESVEMDAEVFNPSYEMVNDQDVNILIKDEKMNSFPFVFSKSGKSYFLKAGRFPVGNYTFTATTVQGKNAYSQKGSFTILPLNIEAVNLVADHGLLARISAAHGANIIYPVMIDSLPDILNQRDDIISVSYTQKRLTDLIGTPWLFFLILSLITFEWILRKRNGI